MESVLGEIREKYAQYGITEPPFVIVKADAGTYGMGIMTVKSVDDVRDLNRKTRNKMAVIKEGRPVNEVIIQEGVYTFESVEGAVAEPVVYMMDSFVVGGFYRVHTERGIDENLNSPGAKYDPLAFETNCHTPDCTGQPGRPAQPLLHLRRGGAAGEPRRRPRGRGARIRRIGTGGQGGERMKLAFVVDPLDQLKAYKDSSIAMMREAARRGHEVHALEARAMFVARRLRAQRRPAPRTWATTITPGTACSTSATRRLADFDLVLMRKDPPFDQEYYYATLLLERAQAEGARVVNDPRALRDWNEKLAILRVPAFAPPTLVASDMARVHAFVDAQGDAILKKLDGMGGTMIFRVRADDPNRNVIVETLTDMGRRTIMAQRYIPEIAQGDKRVLVIGGKPFSHCLARIPRAGETRGNLAAGGTGVARPITARDREIAETVGASLAEAGIAVRGPGRDRRLAHRGERHEPHVHRGDRRADGPKRGARPDGRAGRLKPS